MKFITMHRIFFKIVIFLIFISPMGCKSSSAVSSDSNSKTWATDTFSLEYQIIEIEDSNLLEIIEELKLESSKFEPFSREEVPPFIILSVRCLDDTDTINIIANSSQAYSLFVDIKNGEIFIPYNTYGNMLDGVFVSFYFENEECVNDLITIKDKHDSIIAYGSRDLEKNYWMIDFTPQISSKYFIVNGELNLLNTYRDSTGVLLK